MITMELLGKIRRMHVRDKMSERAIAKRTGLSRNTVHKWLEIPEEVQAPRYVRAEKFGKLTALAEELEQALKADAHRHKQDQRTGKALFAQIKASGYLGGYSCVTDFIREWRGYRGQEAPRFRTLEIRFGRGFPVRLERSRLGGRWHLPAYRGLAHEAVRQSCLLAGGLPQPGSRDAV